MRFFSGKFITFSALVACTATALTMGAYAAETPAPKHNRVCVNAKNIDHFSFPDDKTILFHMKHGKVKIWKNTLKHTCPNMKLQGGIAYELHSNLICGNTLQFSVIRYNNPCVLGTFSPYTPPKKKAVKD